MRLWRCALRSQSQHHLVGGVVDEQGQVSVPLMTSERAEFQNCTLARIS